MAKNNKDIHRVEITFLCSLQNGNQEVRLSYEHSEYKWVNPDDIGNFDLTDYMRKVIENVLKNPLTVR